MIMIFLEIVVEMDFLDLNKKILHEYFSNSTIQGLVYIFGLKMGLFGNFFWILAVILMLTLGIYWSTAMYVDWRINQVCATTKM
jgi:hypothetical protein